MLSVCHLPNMIPCLSKGVVYLLAFGRFCQLIGRCRLNFNGVGKEGRNFFFLKTAYIQKANRFKFAPAFRKVEQHTEFGPWCNGSTADFGSVCLGSSPSGPTTNARRFFPVGVLLSCLRHNNLQGLFFTEGNSNSFYRRRVLGPSEMLRKRNWLNGHYRKTNAPVVLSCIHDVNCSAPAMLYHSTYKLVPNCPRG